MAKIGRYCIYSKFGIGTKSDVAAQFYLQKKIQRGFRDHTEFTSV